MINPTKEYNLKQIRDGKFIPWALHYQTLRRIVEEDLLKAIRTGSVHDRQSRYIITGKDIINYKKQYLKALSKK